MAELADNIEQLPLKTFTEKAYLDYSMYVILDRALPHIGDGLKPVQRRIIYAMSELGLSNLAKFKKAARTVGDVLGKFHPHGDSACYEAMVLMAQDFSLRYPLVDGQGNWGSTDDPKSFAAMRYTEARLAPFAEVLLKELGQGTVTWQPNFDGTLEEPEVLPARLPVLLLNGVSGIAVGMSTDVLPHNLKEVAAACIRLLEEPKATVEQLCEHILGPDFPTEAEIISTAEEIHQIYATGKGSIRARARYEMSSGSIVITALPYQVSGSKVLEQIAAQMVAKKLPIVDDLRDESDHENPVRLVVVPRSNRVDTEALLLHLFATTDLERTYRVNMNVICLDGKPKVVNLREMLVEWLKYRIATVTKRLQYRLEKVLARMHILEGFLIAYLNIDEVIAIVRSAENPRQELMGRFSLTEKQADSILDMKLRQLAKLEEIKIRGEQDELDIERKYLETTLGSKQRLKTLVRKEIKEDEKLFGDARRSPIVERDLAKAINANDLIPSEPQTIILSEKGWVRVAKGHEIDTKTLNYKSGDQYCHSAQGRSNQQAVFLDSTGRSYSLAAHTLPSARGQGEPLTGRFSPAPGTHFVGTLFGVPETQYLLSSNSGYGFIATLKNLYAKNKNGKLALNLVKEATVLKPVIVNEVDSDLLVCVSNTGRMLVFPLCELPCLSKGKGNKMLGIPAKAFQSGEEFMAATAIVSTGQVLKVYSGQRHMNLKLKDLENFMGERGRRGSKLPRGYQRVDGLESI